MPPHLAAGRSGAARLRRRAPFFASLASPALLGAPLWQQRCSAGAALAQLLPYDKDHGNTCHVQAFTRGILCNWLVCLAVWQANAAQSLGGKFVVSLLACMARKGPLYVPTASRLSSCDHCWL